MRAVSDDTKRSRGDVKIPVTVWWPHLAAIIDFVMPPDVRAAMTAFVDGDDCMVAEKRIAFERLLVESHARLAVVLEPLNDTFMRMCSRSKIDDALAIGACLGRAEMEPSRSAEASLPATVRGHVEFVRDYITPPKDKALIERSRSKEGLLTSRQSDRLRIVADRVESRAIDVAIAIGEPLIHVAGSACDRYLRAIIEKHSADSASEPSRE